MASIVDGLVSLGTWTLRNSLEAGVLILLVAALGLLWRHRISPAFRSVLWIAVGIRLLLPVAPPSSLSIFNLLPDSPTAMATAPQSPERLPVDAIGAASSVPEPFLTEGRENRSPGGRWLAVLWLLGFAGILGVAFSRQIRARRWVGGLPEVGDARLHASLRWCALRAGIPSRLVLVECPQVTTAAVFGDFRATHVVVPVGFGTHYSEAEARGIFLHELAHVRRRDLLWNWMTLLVQALHWFNPLVWWAGRQFRAERELICDRLALGHLPEQSHRDYGQALLKSLEFARRGPAPMASFAPFLSRNAELKHRLTMTRNSQSIQAHPLLHAVAALLATAACAITFSSALADDEPREGRRDRDPGPSAEGSRDRDPGPSAEGSRDRDREPGSSAEGSRDRELRVVIRDEDVILNGRIVAQGKLRGVLSGNRIGRAVIQASTNTPMETVLSVMDALRDNGVREVRMGATEAPREGDRGISREGDRGGDRERGPEGRREGDRGNSREGDRGGDRERSPEGRREGDRGNSREGDRGGDRERGPEGRREGDGGGSREGSRDGDGGSSRSGSRDGDR